MKPSIGNRIYCWAIRNRHPRIRKFMRPGGPNHLACYWTLYYTKGTLSRMRRKWSLRHYNAYGYLPNMNAVGVRVGTVDRPVPLALKYAKRSR